MMRASLLLLSALCLSGALAARVRAPGQESAAAPLVQLQAELKQIRQQDATHTQHLLFIVKLREALRTRLTAEDEKLTSANQKVATSINSIMHGQLSQSATLLQRGNRRSERTAEEIAADALKHMQALGELIEEIQGHEDSE